MFGSDYNLWAILLATVANQAIGALWFSPLLFATPWLKGVGLTKESIQANPSKMPFVVSLITALVLAVALSWANSITRRGSAGVAPLRAGASSRAAVSRNAPMGAPRASLTISPPAGSAVFPSMPDSSMALALA